MNCIESNKGQFDPQNLNRTQNTNIIQGLIENAKQKHVYSGFILLIFFFNFILHYDLLIFNMSGGTKGVCLRTSRSLVSTGCSLRELLTTYCSRGSSPLWLLLIRADWQSPTHKVNRYYLNSISHCWGNETMHSFRIGEPTVLLYRTGFQGGIYLLQNLSLLQHS